MRRRGFQVQPWSSRVQADKSNNRMEHYRFGEEGCLFFLPFQEDLERKAEVLEKKIFLLWGHQKALQDPRTRRSRNGIGGSKDTRAGGEEQPDEVRGQAIPFSS
ncbi:uncharacterized protein LOC120650134 isoform X2 [Panicum virgatum]|uniref:uncharacterized protein LOC120650134 isoform X2 n=1 Tax=Panicum virgatum TaxID=38727 RepID=UPI0019D51E58|nr:uncharacterized protein LOC120650134 isoform X2 [Panicum virgatum]